MPCHAPIHRWSATRFTRRGFSLLEVVVSTAIVAATLVPSLELVRDALDVSVETDTRERLALYAASQLEEQLAIAETTWATGAYAGDYAGDGAPEIRFDTVVSDDPLSGGVEGLLMDLRTTTYHDANGDNALGADELRCSFRTKLGRFTTYGAASP